MSALLELENLIKYYATQKAVDDISFSIEKGSIFGLLGPNGAGKTTLLRMITGIFYPDSGNIQFDGRPFNPTEDIINIGYMPEERGLYKKMKIGDHALYLAQLKGVKQIRSYGKNKVLVQTLRNGNLVEQKSGGPKQRNESETSICNYCFT